LKKQLESESAGWPKRERERERGRERERERERKKEIKKEKERERERRETHTMDRSPISSFSLPPPARSSSSATWL
jgi:hypothetical protein